MFDQEKYPWLKSKGYLHSTPKIDVTRNSESLIQKITNPNYIKSYSFFPLLHSVIKERRFRKDTAKGNKRSHTKIKNGKNVKNAKERPIHYATHMDALIFSYYAYLINEQYEKELAKHQNIGDCIIAYRKIKHPEENCNKSTIHFANEVFQEIKKRAVDETVIVLKFDITSFFSHMDHDVLKLKWLSLFSDNGKLPADHYNVYKAATQFSYILKDELRIPSNHLTDKRKGYNEKKLAEIRNEKGIHSFFASTHDLRQAIKTKQLRVYKFPFRNQNGRIRGIPQGLPISAVLANLYLLDFDLDMIQMVKNTNGFYRRYSDDIIVICGQTEAEDFAKTARSKIMTDCKVEISEEKTEVFQFENIEISEGLYQLRSAKIKDKTVKLNIPLTYLGFDFFGHRTAIKAANLAKFYRRMINTVKRKCKYAVSISLKNPGNEPIIFRRQLYRLYTLQSLSKSSFKNRVSRIVSNGKGGFYVESEITERKHKSNYLTYVRNAARIMEEPSIQKQIKNHKKILLKALSKHLTKQLERRGNVGH